MCVIECSSAPCVSDVSDRSQARAPCVGRIEIQVDARIVDLDHADADIRKVPSGSKAVGKWFIEDPSGQARREHDGVSATAFASRVHEIK